MTRVNDRRNSALRSWGVKPRTVARPEVGYRSPDKHFNVVVLPAPLGPRNPTISPGLIEKLTPSTALTSAYRR